jgi:hypothetical protein
MRVPGGPATSLCEKHVWTGSLYSPFSRRRCECHDRGRFWSPVRVCKCTAQCGPVGAGACSLVDLSTSNSCNRRRRGTLGGHGGRGESAILLDLINLERKQCSAKSGNNGKCEVTTIYIYQNMTYLGYTRTSELPPSNHRRAVYGRFGSSCVRAAILGRLRNCRRRRMRIWMRRKDPTTQIACLASCTD